MNSSISNSERWRRFFVRLLGVAAGLGLFIYVFIVTVDPFDVLALSPQFDRVPVASNARFAFPSLARSRRFDSVLVGTSTSRLLRPARLDRLLHVRLANLAMNSARAYEQSRLLQLFAWNHAAPRLVMIGIDDPWCVTGAHYDRYTYRAFPEWMYDTGAKWHGYLKMFSLYALTQAIQEFRILIGIKKERYGADGYTDFLPDDRLYDAARAVSHLRAAAAHANGPAAARDPSTLRFPTHVLMGSALGELPAETRKILFFVPYYLGIQGRPGSERAAVLRECKRRIARLAGGIPNTAVVDFMIPSPITRDPTNYWDPLHYRVAIADRLVDDIATADRGVASAAGDYRLLLGGTASATP
jgi:hypothetical protein